MCEPLKTREKPCCYPMNTSSGIYDAQAFWVGRSETVHRPWRYPDGNKVVARCGVWGLTGVDEGRLAFWSPDVVTCRTCLDRS